MLNSAFINEQAAKLAERVRREGGSNVAQQVRLALSLVTSRSPSDAEVQRGVKLIGAMQKEDNISADAALTSFCLLALNLNEFLYLD